MDLETENRIAAILMKEAAELRRQAEQEGVHAYLRKPKVKPNSRFLSATVLGVQQANRAVEVNEMWRVRQKELELDGRLTGRQRGGNNSVWSHTDSMNSQRSDGKRHTCTKKSASASCSSSKRGIQDCYSGDVEGFKDEEIDEFLHSRVKRGRGAVGSRMDETGPYLPTLPDSEGKQLACAGWGSSERREHSVVLGPQKPSLLKSCESSDEESLWDTPKKAEKVGSSKRHSRKHRSKDEPRDEKKKKKKIRENKRCKHHK